MSPSYKAFISYSHADDAWAAWLQRALERYRIPARLRALRPELPRRLYPVFLDREELASSGDLGESIRTALAQAEALVVICSPAAAASRWVNEEIRTFRQMAPERPVLAMIVSGSPDPAAGDCAFPAALISDGQGNPLPEPLASDPRDNADGRRGAFLKIAAGLINVGIDDLRQRDQQRRLRLVSGLAVGAFAIALVTIGLAINAQQARQDAELRRGQAEGLIAFMLGDLRERLQPVGRLDVLDAVGEQAMEYFAMLGDEGSQEDVLARAMALRQIGEVRFAQGQLDAALDAFDQSREVAAALHHNHPDRARYLFELGQAEFWVGYVAWEQGRLDAAETSMNAYMAHTRALLEREPANADYRLELAYAFGNLGAISRQQRDFSDALQQFQASIETAQPLSDADPGNANLLMLLCESWSWSGSTWLDLGSLAQSEAAFQIALGYAASAHAITGSPNHRDEMGDLAAFLADVYLKQGNLQAGVVQLENTLLILDELATHDPENARWTSGRLRTLRQLAEVAASADWNSEAERRLEEAISGLSALVELDGTRLIPRRQLALALRLKALLDHQAGNMPQALSWAEQAHRVLAVGGDELRTGTDAAIVGEMLGLAAAGNGDDAQARIAWEVAIGALPEPGKQDTLQKALFARLAAHLGRETEWRQLVRELQDIGFADPRFPLPANDS